MLCERVNKNNAAIIFLIGIVLVGGFSFILGQNTGTNTEQIIKLENIEKTTISVSGNAERKVEPNLVKFTVGVETVNENAELSVSENAEIMEKVTQALIEKGIPKNKIKTSYYYIYEDRIYPKEDKEPMIRYRTTHSLSVETTQISEIGKIIDEVTKAGANQVSNIQFTLDDKTLNEIKKELVNEAILNSKEKADSMASELNQEIVGVKSMSTSSDYYIGYNNYDKMLSVGIQMEEMRVDTEIFQSEVTVNAYVSGIYYSQ